MGERGSVDMAERKLTLKQQRFADAYVYQCPGNASEAARIAGYKGSAGTLAVVGHENINKPNVAKLIASLERLMKEETRDERAEALKKLWAIATDPKTSPRDQVAALKEIAAISGWHSEKLILETPHRQRELDASAQDVARRAAIATYATAALPPGVAAILPGETVPKAAGNEGETH